MQWKTRAPAILWLPIELTRELRQNVLPTPPDSSGIPILVCMNTVIDNKNKRTALESTEEITVYVGTHSFSGEGTERRKRKSWGFCSQMIKL